jgi:hypothetical protein
MRIILTVLFFPFSNYLFAQSKNDLRSWRYNFSPLELNSSLGVVSFYRIDSFPGEERVFVSFNVYPIADSLRCRAKSRLTRSVSSCSYPNVGGDLYRLGDYILLNESVCISCKDKKVADCRSMISEILSSIKTMRYLSIDELLNRLPIKHG